MPSIAQLQRAIQIQEQIVKLEVELKAVLSGDDVGAMITASAVEKPAKTKRTMSPETIAKMRASQQARWAAKNGSDTPPAVETKPATKAPKITKKVMSPEARAKISAAVKERWAARKKASPAAKAPKQVKKAKK